MDSPTLESATSLVNPFQGTLVADQLDLFSDPSAPASPHEAPVSTTTPLARRMRPSTLDEFRGQKHLFERYRFLKTSAIPGLILWGPPGTGKTTLAHILAHQSGRTLYAFNAVLGGVADLRKLIERALEMKTMTGDRPAIFIDEIHRFNKAQQDALLPYVESGDFTLFGATTENPRASINGALLSRVQIMELKSLTPDAIFDILCDARTKEKNDIPDEILHFIADRASGDARKALNILETALSQGAPTLESIEKLLLENARRYDRNQNRHYDVISSFIKSMRGSDPDAALLWLAVMLDGGEDPVFIARRMVILASEDVGNADPMALSVAMNALLAVQNIGMPEARITLGQAATYLASTVKSNAAYMGINEALEYVSEHPTLEVPEHLKNYPDKNHLTTYQYPHDFPGHYVDQRYTRDPIPNFYRPSDQGREQSFRELKVKRRHS